MREERWERFALGHKKTKTVKNIWSESLVFCECITQITSQLLTLLKSDVSESLMVTH